MGRGLNLGKLGDVSGFIWMILDAYMDFTEGYLCEIIMINMDLSEGYVDSTSMLISPTVLISATSTLNMAISTP